MAEFVRYICNKKNTPVLREDCKDCSEHNPCAKDGKWCYIGALVVESAAEGGYIARGSVNITENLAMPVMRDMSTVTIHLGDGQSVDVLREDMKKRLYEGLYKHLYQDLCP